MNEVNKDICNVLSSGSIGNCEIYHRIIACDMGIPFSLIKPYIKDLKLILLSHKHGDHFNISTIKRLSLERPTLRFGICDWMLPLMEGIKNVDIYEFGKWYDYGQFKISVGKLYHDVPNCFFRIDKDGHKTFRATDTYTLQNITALNYDLYAIESNYDEETIDDSIREIESKGGYAYQKGVLNSHLSQQQAKDFIFKNAGPNSKVIRLHESKNN